MALTNRKVRALLASAAGKGGGSPSLVAAGATWGWIGDGLNAPSGGVGSGLANPVHQFMALMGLRVQPVPLPIIARSGSTIARDISTNRALINPYAIDAMAKQVPDIFIIGTMGANDNLLSTNPGANPASGQTTNVYLQDWYDAVNYAYSKFVAYGGKLFVVMATASSTKVGESTYRTTVWNAQKAFVAALTASDSKVVFADITDMTDPTQWSVDTSSSYTHWDERGSYHAALAVLNAITGKIVAATDDECIDAINAGTYPLMTGSQLDTDQAMAGTGGTVTGPGISGTLADSKVITNNTGATGITVAQVATSGGRTKTVVTLAGTASADGKIMIQDKSNISLAGTPGQPFRTGAILRIPANVARNAGSEWNNQWGFWGGGATSLVDNTRAGANETHAIASAIVNGTLSGTSGVVPAGNSTTFAGKRTWAFFAKSGTSLAGTFELERTFAYKPSNRLAAAMAYIGDFKDSFGNTVLNTNWRLRPTGTISQASGGTIRVEPGTWNLFGLTEADFATRRLYKGNSGNTAVGSGTLIGAEMSGSTWTQTFAGGVVTTGDLVYAEITDREGNTYRSAITVTAT